jgi:hypothetical protein
VYFGGTMDVEAAEVLFSFTQGGKTLTNLPVL